MRHRGLRESLSVSNKDDLTTNLNEQTIKELERFWEPDVGVFWKLREGILDGQELEAVAMLLESFESQKTARFLGDWFL